jgi:hypothetical protein
VARRRTYARLSAHKHRPTMCLEGGERSLCQIAKGPRTLLHMRQREVTLECADTGIAAAARTTSAGEVMSHGGTGRDWRPDDASVRLDELDG